MKKLILSVVVALGATLTASAFPIKIGPVVGVNINSFNISGVVSDPTNVGGMLSNLNSDNRCGIAAGVMAKFTVPVINVGVDASVMYEHRTTKITGDDNYTEKLSYNYLTVPIHVRYDVPMPVISQYFYPTIFTGPNLAFNVGKDLIDNFKAKKCNVGWDFGVGVTLIQHLQISAAYTLGISNAITSKVLGTQGADIKGKTSGWTVTAAYLF